MVPAQRPPAAPQQPGRQEAPPAPRRAPRGHHGGVSAASGAPAGDTAASAPARRGRTSSLIRRAGDSTCSNVANFWWWYSACARRLGVSLRTNGLTQLTVIYQSTQESARALGTAQPPGVHDPTAAWHAWARLHAAALALGRADQVLHAADQRAQALHLRAGRGRARRRGRPPRCAP